MKGIVWVSERRKACKVSANVAVVKTDMSVCKCVRRHAWALEAVPRF